MPNRYDDIINLPHWEPKYRQRMPLANRAAQFAPFAALVGHDEAIRETARTTDAMSVLDIESANLLNEKINLLIENIGQLPEIEVTYFVKDYKKAGGAYKIHQGRLRRIEEAAQTLIFNDGTEIAVALISDLRGDIFSHIDLQNF